MLIYPNVALTMANKPEEKLEMNHPKSQSTLFNRMLSFKLNTAGFSQEITLFAAIHLRPMAGNMLSIEVIPQELMCRPTELLRTKHELQRQESAQLSRVIECKPSTIQMKVKYV